MAGLRDALKGVDSETITAKTNELARAAIKLGEAISAQRQGDSGNANGPGNKNREDIVDADFTEVDDATGKKEIRLAEGRDGAVGSGSGSPGPSV